MHQTHVTSLQKPITQAYSKHTLQTCNNSLHVTSLLQLLSQTYSEHMSQTCNNQSQFLHTVATSTTSMHHIHVTNLQLNQSYKHTANPCHKLATTSLTSMQQAYTCHKLAATNNISIQANTCHKLAASTLISLLQTHYTSLQLLISHSTTLFHMLATTKSHKVAANTSHKLAVSMSCKPVVCNYLVR